MKHGSHLNFLNIFNNQRGSIKVTLWFTLDFLLNSRSC